jgi:hypothetical protein
MKHLGFNTRIWGWTAMTIFLTMTAWYIYKVETDVLSRGQAMEILGEYGTVSISGDVMIFSQRGEIQSIGYPTELLQALEMMSENFEIHM